jgi:hypothetical protein
MHGLHDALTTTESGIPLDEIAKKLLGEGHSTRSDEDVRQSTSGEVPWSWRASILAGLVAACMQAGVVVLSSQTPTAILPGIPMEVGGAGSTLTPAVIAYGLWNGGSEAASTLMIAHFALKIMKTTSPVAYALGGAIAGAASGYVIRMLIGGEDTMVTDAIAGLIAGFLFRVIAGVQRAKT